MGSSGGEKKEMAPTQGRAARSRVLGMRHAVRI